MDLNTHTHKFRIAADDIARATDPTQMETQLLLPTYIYTYKL
jgi:hypothetical protein